MTKYIVGVRFTSLATIEVEATTYEEALREAEFIAADDPSVTWVPDCIDACWCSEAEGVFKVT